MAIETVAIADSGRSLRLDCSDGTTSVLDARFLWAQCPSAAGRRRRIDGRHTSVPDGLTITSVDPVGRYGLNIAFSDGHDRGIYPWTFLAGLQQPRQPADYIID